MKKEADHGGFLTDSKTVREIVSRAVDVSVSRMTLEGRSSFRNVDHYEI